MKTLLSIKPLSTDWALLALRIFAGGAMLSHGIPKLIKALNGDLGFGDPLGIGSELSFILVIFAEFLCSILLILGLTTRFALIPLMITMAVGYFIVHGGDDFASKELPFLYLSIYIVLFLTGPGKFSLDARIFGSKTF